MVMNADESRRKFGLRPRYGWVDEGTSTLDTRGISVGKARLSDGEA